MSSRSKEDGKDHFYWIIIKVLKNIPRKSDKWAELRDKYVE